MSEQNRFSRRAFLARPAALALTLVLGAGLGYGKKKKPPEPLTLPGQVNNLAKQLWGMPLDESGPLTDQIQKLALDHIEEWLSSQPAQAPVTDVAARRELESVFALVHFPIYAWPRTFAVKWKDGTLIGVGYTLGWSDYDRANVVALYERSEGGSRQVALTHFVTHTDMHYEFLPTPPSGDLRFIVWGTRLGKSQPRLTAVLYEYDGQNLKSLWEKKDAYDGTIDVDPDKVVVRFLIEAEYVRAVQRNQKPPRYEDVFTVTPEGLKPAGERVIPFTQR